MHFRFRWRIARALSSLNPKFLIMEYHLNTSSKYKKSIKVKLDLIFFYAQKNLRTGQSGKHWKIIIMKRNTANMIIFQSNRNLTETQTKLFPNPCFTVTIQSKQSGARDFSDSSRVPPSSILSGLLWWTSN